MVVENLEADPNLQDAVLSVHHATFHTFSGPCVKIVENQLGRGFFKLQHQVVAPVQIGIPPSGPPGAPPGSQPGAQVIQIPMPPTGGGPPPP